VPLRYELGDVGAFLKQLTPAALKKLARARLDDLVLAEVGRSRARVSELEKRYPAAEVKELGQRLVDAKKSVASAVGGVTGAFGLLGIPGDLLVMSWLQVVLVVDVATLFKVNLKGERARAEVLDVLGYANGVGPLTRAGPRLLGTLAGRLLQQGGLESLGRALPLAAAPISAYLNQRHIQEVGEQVVRFYAGLEKAKAKSKKRTTRST
jgi:uncharacterized protein (DUF697 family)